MYVKYFGLREPPFNLTPDPRFFFDSQLHREAWAALFYGVKEKKGFVVLTGEVGTGKTTLLRKVLRSLEATHRSVFIFNTLITGDELLEAILRDLDLDPAPKRMEMFQQFNEFLLEQLKKGHTVSVLIDEAQNLNEEALESVRLLSNLETDREKLLQIVLVGQPELDAKLNSRALRQLKQRVSLWCRLERLSKSDTEAYIAHRLSIAGYKGSQLFTEGAWQVIWEQSRGIPRLINTVCDNALVTAFAMSKTTVTPDIIHEAVRDLRLTAADHGIESSYSERRGSGHSSKKNPEDFEQKSWREAEPGPMRMLCTPAPGVEHNLALQVAPANALLPEVDGLQRESLQPKSGAIGEEPKEGHNRIAAAEEKRAAARDGRGAHKVAMEVKPFVFGDDRVVPAPLFEEILAALASAMGPMAPLVLREKVTKLGESWQEFPLARVADLVREVKAEILNDGMRSRFEERVLQRVISHFRDPTVSVSWRER